MDDINLSGKPFVLRGLKPGFPITAAAFILGAAAVGIMRGKIINCVMSIIGQNPIVIWLCLLTLVIAITASVIMPAARVIAVLFSTLCGTVAALISYVYSSLKLFSADFFAFSAVVFLFTSAIAYISDCVFTLAPKLRSFVCADRRLRVKLNVFCAAAAAFVVASAAASALFIL